MINKELKYRTELFELLKNDLSKISNNKEVMNLIENMFVSDDLSIEEVVKKITEL